MSALHQEAIGARTRIERNHQGLPAELKKAAGYAIFPSVGRASAVLGGSYGHGVVYEHEQPIGEASITQVTIGVQVGGQTFSEIVIFQTKDALERFKRGRVSFTANASADVVKAAASGTTDYEKDVVAHAYTQGGMLLEASLGVQKFSFQAQSTLDEGAKEAKGEKDAERASGAGEAGGAEEEEEDAGDQEDPNHEPA